MLNPRYSIAFFLLIALVSSPAMADDADAYSAAEVQQAMFNAIAAIERAAGLEPTASQGIAAMSNELADIFGIEAGDDADRDGDDGGGVSRGAGSPPKLLVAARQYGLRTAVGSWMLPLPFVFGPQQILFHLFFAHPAYRRGSQPVQERPQFHMVAFHRPRSVPDVFQVG